MLDRNNFWCESSNPSLYHHHSDTFYLCDNNPCIAHTNTHTQIYIYIYIYIYINICTYTVNILTIKVEDCRTFGIIKTDDEKKVRKMYFNCLSVFPGFRFPATVFRGCSIHNGMLSLFSDSLISYQFAGHNHNAISSTNTNRVKGKCQLPQSILSIYFPP